MRIAVCVKQVPDTNEIRINPETGTLIRDGVPSILNNDDANALEQALQIKDARPDTEVVAITMGPPQAKEMLQECLAMGADEAILLSDRALGGSDTWATSNALAAGLRKAGPFDLIFAGRQAIDGDTAQVGPQIAPSDRQKTTDRKAVIQENSDFNRSASSGMPSMDFHILIMHAASIYAYGGSRLHASKGDAMLCDGFG